MSAEPIRDPEEETEERPRPAASDATGPGAADRPAGPTSGQDAESLTGTATGPVTVPGETLTPEAAANAEAAAAAEADPNMDPDASESAVAAADAQEVASTAQAVATVDAASDAAAGTPPADSAAAEKASRRPAILAALRTLMVFVIGAALLVGGVAIGNYVFLTTRADTGATAGPGSDLVDPPPAAQEFIAALAVNDADAVRSSLDQQPHIDLMREMELRGIQKVDRIEVLGTSADGPRSATEILMQYQRRDGISSAINLVILVDGGKIEGFR